MSQWTEEQKELVIARYLEEMEVIAEEDRGASSTEIVKEIAAEVERSPNSVRNILSRAKVYIAKAPAKKTTAASGGAKRVNKAEAIQNLKDLIKTHAEDHELDAEILDKLTGKAAIYLAEVVTAVTS